MPACSSQEAGEEKKEEKQKEDDAGGADDPDGRRGKQGREEWMLEAPAYLKKTFSTNSKAESKCFLRVITPLRGLPRRFSTKEEYGRCTCVAGRKPAGNSFDRFLLSSSER